jgi:hypothetical protein
VAVNLDQDAEAISDAAKNGADPDKARPSVPYVTKRS